MKKMTKGRLVFQIINYTVLIFFISPVPVSAAEYPGYVFLQRHGSFGRAGICLAGGV